ncbi:MAG: hypothetical protein V4543_06965 [Bacteroidota bacterium]
MQKNDSQLLSAESEFQSIADGLADREVTQGAMFGKKGLMVKRKAFLCLFGSSLVFKLNPEDRHEALTAPGAENWDPSGKHRPMKEWIVLPEGNEALWQSMAGKALKFVSENN